MFVGCGVSSLVGVFGSFGRFVFLLGFLRSGLCGLIVPRGRWGLVTMDVCLWCDLVVVCFRWCCFGYLVFRTTIQDAGLLIWCFARGLA